LLTPSLSLEALSDSDLVIEAVFEEMQIKKDLFAKLCRIVRQGTILASNTSYLDLNEIAAATSRPQDVIGMHFFSPANVMRLLEVVRGKATAKDAVATVLQLAKTIGKTPVLAGVCHGFIANRIMAPRRIQAEQLALEGSTPQEIDKAIFDFGFAMGPFQMMDLVGLDVLIRGQAERSLRGDLVALGRLGQKQNGGFYDYDEDRRATPSPVAMRVIADFAAHKDISRGGSLTADALIARLLYVVVNEGAKILEEGIAIRASDIDVACVLGYNWPAYTGGPMFWADTVGLPAIVAGLKAQGIEPARLLAEKAVKGEMFTR
jgi:3-hydroxyacyl-CoA dehydrogenase